MLLGGVPLSFVSCSLQQSGISKTLLLSLWGVHELFLIKAFFKRLLYFLNFIGKPCPCFTKNDLTGKILSLLERDFYCLILIHCE